MKFANITLIATASAIKIKSTEEKCHLSMQESASAYHWLDKNKNGTLDYDEIRAGMDYVAKYKLKREWTKE
jgi:hypothetical protein